MSITTLVRDLPGSARAALRRLADFDRMPAEQRERWQAPRNVPGLARTCALYLEGRIPSQPAYQPNRGIDQETQALVPLLARANRAGFYTIQSQPAQPGGGQALNAFVVGFAECSTAMRIHYLLCGSGLSYLFRRPRYTLIQRGKVSWKPSTARQIRNNYAVCHPAAVDALVDAVQVVIEDPMPGRDDRLWPLLDRFTHTAAARGELR